MKHLILTALLAASLTAHAQQPLGYGSLLNLAKEIDFSDSLELRNTTDERTLLDSNTVKSLFPQVLPDGPLNKFRNRTYSLAGKITTHQQFDLLVLMEEKTKGDSIITRVVYLISMKKTGEYIASLKAAVSGTKKKTGYYITSCLYKDFKIVQDSKITVDNKAYDDMALYKISAAGRFISYPRME
ncbi:MAG: hypothetical protein U0U70_11195 [Chitinophagaceae bacterium]